MLRLVEKMIGRIIYSYLGYYKTKKEALEALAEYNRTPYSIEDNKASFADVYERWSKNHFEKVSDSSIERYSNAYRKYCKSLYKKRFRDIKLNDLQWVIDNCGMAHPTRASIKTLFNVLFSYAIQHDITDKNYAQFVDVGQREGKINRTPFTQEEINKLFQYVDKLDYCDTALIQIFSGLRVSEMLNIEIKNVHLEDRYMVGRYEIKSTVVIGWSL